MKYKYKRIIHRDKMCAMISPQERERVGRVQKLSRQSPRPLAIQARNKTLIYRRRSSRTLSSGERAGVRAGVLPQHLLPV